MASLRHLFVLPLIAVLLLTTIPQATPLRAQAGSEPVSAARPSALQPMIYLPVVQMGGASTISATISSQGGELVTPDKQVRLVIPAGAVSETVTVSFAWNSSAPARSGLASLSSPFDLTARTAQGQLITQFAKPLQIELGGSGVQGSVLYYYDTTQQRWVALPSSFDAQSGILTGTTNHFTTFVVATSEASCEIPAVGAAKPGVTLPANLTTAFQKVYEDNGLASGMGLPVDCVKQWGNNPLSVNWYQEFPEMPNRGASAIFWNDNKEFKKAYVVRGWILNHYSSLNDKSGPDSWLGAPISNETIAPPDLVSLDTSPSGQHPWSYGGEPISYFVGGYISRRQGESAFAANTYQPAICDVNIAVSDSSGGKPQIQVDATIIRAPGWPTSDQTSDPTDAYFTLVFPSGEKHWITLSQNSLTSFSGTVATEQWADTPLVTGNTISVYLDTYNRKGKDKGWQPKVRTYPIGVVYQSDWPKWEKWLGSQSSLIQLTLTDGAGGALPNDNPQCLGAGGNPGFGIKVPPVAIPRVQQVASGPFLEPAIVDMGANETYSYILDGLASYDPDGGPVVQAWQLLSCPPTADCPIVDNVEKLVIGPRQLLSRHAVGDIGTWKFRLHVEDDEKQTSTTDFFVIVRDSDQDDDGLSDQYEKDDGKYPDPRKADSDGDQLSDGFETLPSIKTVPGETNPFYYRPSDTRATRNLYEINQFSEYYRPVDTNETGSVSDVGLITDQPSNRYLALAMGNIVQGPQLRHYETTCTDSIFGCSIEFKEWIDTVDFAINLTSDSIRYRGDWYGKEASVEPATFTLGVFPRSPGSQNNPGVEVDVDAIERQLDQLASEGKIDDFKASADIWVKFEPVMGIGENFRSAPFSITSLEGLTVSRDEVHKYKPAGLKEISLSGEVPLTKKLGLSLGMGISDEGDIKGSIGPAEFVLADAVSSNTSIESGYDATKRVYYIRQEDLVSITHSTQSLFRPDVVITSPQLKFYWNLSADNTANRADIVKVSLAGDIHYKSKALPGKTLPREWRNIQSNHFQNSLYLLLYRSDAGQMQAVPLSINSSTDVTAALHEAAISQLASTTIPVAEPWLSQGSVNVELSQTTLSPNVSVQASQFTDVGVDDNRNKKFEFLQVNTSLQVDEPGRYLVRGSLVDSAGNLIRLVEREANINAGLNNIPLLFDGVSIGERRVSGTYRLASFEVLNPTTGEVYLQKLNAYTTKPYNYFDFERTGAPVTLAKVEAGNLVLLIGPRAAERGIAVDQVDEEFIVRQLDPEGTHFMISAFGITEERVIPSGGRILAQAGDGNDTIRLLNGLNADGDTIPFTASAQLSGGSGDDRLITGDGVDTLNGEEGNDSIDGGASADILTGGPGNDQIEGNAGDDQIYGDEQLACADTGQSTGGNDTLRGGAGNDQINGGGGNDTLHGDAGDDTLCGNNGDDLLDGDTEIAADVIGNDTLYGGDGNDELHGRGGDDQLFGEAGDDRLFGEAGGDNLSGGMGVDDLDGGDGRDYLFGDDGHAIRTPGTADATDVVFSEDLGVGDHALGGSGDDVIYGEGGDDVLSGGAGQDRIFGNAGNDTLNGDADDDLLYGDAGDDLIYGGTGNDVIHGDLRAEGEADDHGQDDGEDAHRMVRDDTSNGSTDNDVLRGDLRAEGEADDHDQNDDKDDYPTGGNDTLNGGDGQDRIFGNAGNDTINGDADADILYGDAGDDLIYGGTGNDVIHGDLRAEGEADDHSQNNGEDAHSPGGNDTLNGGDGQDRIFGNAGNDTINGDADADILYGDAGDDIIYGGTGNDVIHGDLRAEGEADDHSQNTSEDARSPGGNDTLYGGDGQDRIFGNAGNDTLNGDAGDDALNGDAGDDIIYGGTGNDMLRGDLRAEGEADDHDQNDSKDGLVGDDHNTDHIRLNDQLFGQDGNDWLWGDYGDDMLDGGAGHDRLDGGAGDYDQLIGGDGNDFIVDDDGVNGAHGGVGNDTLSIMLREGWRATGGQPRFENMLSGGYGDDTVTLTLKGDETAFFLNISGDEWDNPPSPLEGKMDHLDLHGRVRSDSVIVKFEHR